ncbi:MAG: flagellar export chaperone FliS [Thermodesulfobacteriota bacterium]
MKGIKAYQKVQVMTSDRVRLVVMLYEGVIKFNRLAALAIKDNDIEKRSEYINRSIAIISELYNALDMQRGEEVAINLRDLYLHSLTRLAEANNKNSIRIIEGVTALFAEVKEGWDALVASGAGAEKPSIEAGAGYGA